MSERSTPQEKKDFALASLRAIMTDGLPIDENKMSCLYQIFATIELDQPLERQNIVRMSVFEPENVFDPEIIARVLETDRNDEIRTELAKQAIMACQASGRSKANANLNDFLVNELNFSKEQIDVLKEGVRWGNIMVGKLKANIDLSENDIEALKSLEKRAKNIGLSATAIGLPMTGLYFAGITGFSAVGITTGLAAIGNMSGLTLFGLLNPMTAGVLALGLLGYGIYHIGKKIINFFNKENERKTTEETMRKLYNLIRRIRRYAEEDRRRFIADKKSVEETCRQYEEKAQTLDDERNHLDQEIESLEKQKESASFEREELESKCNALTQEMKSLEEQNKITSLEIEKIDCMLDSLGKEKSTLEKQKQSSIFEHKKLEHGGIFRKAWSYLKGRTKKVIELEIEEFGNKIENCLSQIKENENRKDASYQSIDEIKNKINTIINDLHINKKSIGSANRKIVEIEDKMEKNLDKVELNQKQKDNIDREIDRLNLEIENLNRIISLLGHVIEVHRSIDQMRLGHDSKPLLGFDGSK